MNGRKNQIDLKANNTYPNGLKRANKLAFSNKTKEYRKDKKKKDQEVATLNASHFWDNSKIK